MTATIKIDMRNDAFEANNGAELARILRDLADRLDRTWIGKGAYCKLYDANGNCVGHFTTPKR